MKYILAAVVKQRNGDKTGLYRISPHIVTFTVVCGSTVWNEEVAAANPLRSGSCSTLVKCIAK